MDQQFYPDKIRIWFTRLSFQSTHSYGLHYPRHLLAEKHALLVNLLSRIGQSKRINYKCNFRIQQTEYKENNCHTLNFRPANAGPFDQPALEFGMVLYNSSLSYLRLGIDGNLRLYTYRANVCGNAWSLLYTLFDRRVSEFGRVFEDEYQLPKRCAKFGLCEDNQCVGCPTPNGVFAWSKDCDSKVPGCKANGFRYYELKGVDHFTVKHRPGAGPVKREDCESKCTKDCECMGYFYHTDRSTCWIANELKTLTRVGNSTHLAFIKTSIR